MPEPLTKERVLEALKRVKGPDLRSDIVSEGLVSEIVINKGKVYFALQVEPARARELEGLRVGVLDADIYGPSMPRLLGLKGQPQQIAGNQLEPLQAYGLKVMSMGFLVDEETPMIWRGPMVMSALSQMLKDVAWGELDVLVVDMPPGTGDAQLTMAQQVPLAGAVIVSTPQ